jgi:hypothetical protein
MRTHVVPLLIPALLLALVLAPAATRGAPAGKEPTGTLWVSVMEPSRHRAIPFATIVVPDQGRGGLTDSDGWAMINKLRPGRHLVEVHCLGYRLFADSVWVRARASDTLRVVLREVVVHEEPFMLLPAPPRSSDTTFRLLPITPRRRDHEVAPVSATGR